MTDDGKLALMKDQTGRAIDFETFDLPDDAKAAFAKNGIFMDAKQPIVQQ